MLNTLLQKTEFVFQITCKALSCCQASIMWYLEMIDESGPEKVTLFYFLIACTLKNNFQLCFLHLFSFLRLK